LDETTPSSIGQKRPLPRSNVPLRESPKVFSVTTALTAPKGLLIVKSQVPSAVGGAGDGEPMEHADKAKNENKSV